MTWAVLTREKNLDAGNFGLIPDEKDGISFQTVLFLGIAIAIFLAVALMAFKVRRRYQGYAAPGADKSMDVAPITPGEMDSLSGRRILM